MRLLALARHHVPVITEACADWQELSAYGSPYWRPRSPAELERKIAATAGPAVVSEYTFVIDHEGRLVGECSLHAIDWRNRVAQVGVCIWDPADRGAGFGRAAATELVAWADDHLDLKRLEACIIADNTASLRLFTHLGFTPEAVLRGRYVQAGERHDMHILGRLRSGQTAPPALSPAVVADPP